VSLLQPAQQVRTYQRILGFLPVGDTVPAAAVAAFSPNSVAGYVEMQTRVADLGVKQALLTDDPDVYFTTPHFNGYPAILVRLDRIAVAELGELIIEAWLARAPKRLAEEYLRLPR
jgi:hypothetical protein